MGIGDWGLVIAIPNPQSPIPIYLKYILNNLLNKNKVIKLSKLNNKIIISKNI